VEAYEKAIAQPSILTLSLLQHCFNETSARFVSAAANIRRRRRSERAHRALNIAGLGHRQLAHGSARITGLRRWQWGDTLHLTVGHVRSAERRPKRHAAADATLALTGSATGLATGHSALSAEHLLHECLLVSWGKSIHVHRPLGKFGLGLLAIIGLIGALGFII
jgi:hypothetical protein